jgi:hypothetical protein
VRSHTKASTAGTTQRQTTGLAAGLAFLLLLALFAAPAFAAEPPEYLSSFGPDGTEASDFGVVGSVAVDQQTGAVYVIGKEDEFLYKSLRKFDTDGNPVDFGGSAPYISGNEIAGLSAQRGGESQIAVDSASHKIYVTDHEGKALRAFEADGEPSLFTAGTGSGTNEISFANARGVAVDANGDIYVSEYEAEVVKVYAPSGEQITQFEAETPANLAVNSNGVVYVTSYLGANGDVLKFTPNEFPVSGATTYTAASEPFDPFNSFTVAVDPATNDIYVAHTILNFQPPEIAWYDENGTLLATFAGPGEEGEVRGAPGLAIDSVSKRVFVANDQLEFARVEIFGPEVIIVGRPTIESTSVADVAANSATLRARINPNTFDTTYHFEYGLGELEAEAAELGREGAARSFRHAF